MSLIDGPLIPETWSEDWQKPEHIAQEILSKQLAWLYLESWVPDGKEFVHVGVPEDWAGLALRFTDDSKMLIAAAPVDESVYRTRLVWRWFEPPRVVNKSDLVGILRGMGRQPVVSPLQQEVFGLIVRNVVVQPAPNAMRGQTMDIEFSEGRTLQVRTRRRAQRIDPGQGHAAAFEIGLRRTSTTIYDGLTGGDWSGLT